MTALDALGARILEAIPLARHLQFSLLEYQPGALLLGAPLAPNINDKGTFFAGSQAALLTLGGWALTTLEGEACVERVDVVAAESSLLYVAPLEADAHIRVHAVPDDLAVFARRLQRRGRARLAIAAELMAPGKEVAARFTAYYLARDLSASHESVD